MKWYWKLPLSSLILITPVSVAISSFYIKQKVGLESDKKMIDKKRNDIIEEKNSRIIDLMNWKQESIISMYRTSSILDKERIEILNKEIEDLLSSIIILIEQEKKDI